MASSKLSETVYRFRDHIYLNHQKNWKVSDAIAGSPTLYSLKCLPRAEIVELARFSHIFAAHQFDGAGEIVGATEPVGDLLR